MELESPSGSQPWGDTSKDRAWAQSLRDTHVTPNCQRRSLHSVFWWPCLSTSKAHLLHLGAKLEGHLLGRPHLCPPLPGVEGWASVREAALSQVPT